MKKHKTTKTLLVLAIIALITAATYAFTASNTFSGGAGSAGSGSSSISGYDVTNVHYTNLGTNFATVSFDLDNPATTVQVSFDAGPSHSCSNTGGTSWTCNASDAIGPAANLNVTALD
jgi:hypothetical protein